MSFGRLTVDLWRRAPVWRFLVIGAVVVTVVAIVSRGPAINNNNQVGTTTSGTTSGGATGGATGGTTGGTTGNGNANPPVAQACGPAVQPSKQPTMVISGTGQMPPNVSSPGGQSSGGGMSASTQARIQQFVFEVDAAVSDGREGESCVRMVGALGLLENLDYAYADCFAQGEAKFKRAKGCEADVKASDARFDRLENAAETVKKDSSAQFVKRLADAWTNMRSFDKSTERWTQMDDITSRAEQAVADIQRSDERIKRLETAASATAGSKDANSLQALAHAGQLTALDRARLNSSQNDMLKLAVDAKKKLAESDQRFLALETALAGNSSTDSEARSNLIEAVSRLEQFDIARATPEQVETINTANATAATYAMENLLKSSLSFNPATASPPAYERLRDLRSLVLKYGGVEEFSPEVTQALDTAKLAEAALAQSDGRIRTMQEVVTLVREGGPAEFGNSVIQAYEAIRPFDNARFTDEEKRIFTELSAARDVSIATKSLQLTRSVPLFLSINGDDLLLRQAERELREDLISGGFNIVSAREQSAVALALSIGAVELKELQFSGSSIRTAEVDMSLRGVWTLTDQTITIPVAQGEAIRGEADALKTKAVSDAVSQLLKNMIKLVDDQ